MFFHSLEFFVFFIIVYGLYLVLAHRWQNLLLLSASYIFYSFWDWRFLSLIIISTIVDYFCGIKIESSQDTKIQKFLLTISLVSNLGLLAVFKYFNFFISSASSLCSVLGFNPEPFHFNIVLPVGISFYTFQTLSYTLDIYRGKMQATNRFFDFALYVSFFPQLVAGPIERASRLLPQILNKRTVRFEDFKQGCFLIYWGLFEKMFIASLLAKIADPIFSITESQNGAKILVGLYAFTFQIFCDFDAYSNIARGLARCMGIELMINFNIPYIAKNPKEFWSRWHISLSTWLRDYLYIPFGGNKWGKWLTMRNLMLTMLLGGLWHGASWTFVLWGIYQGALLITHRLKEQELKLIKNSKIFGFFKWLIFFHLIVLGWLIFRSQSVSQISQMTRDVFLNFNFNSETKYLFIRFCAICLPLWIIQYAQHRSNDLMYIYKKHWLIQTFIYSVMAYLIIGWGVLSAEEFIYFQF